MYTESTAPKLISQHGNKIVTFKLGLFLVYDGDNLSKFQIRTALSEVEVNRSAVTSWSRPLWPTGPKVFIGP